MKHLMRSGSEGRTGQSVRHNKGIGIDKYKMAHRKDDDNIRPDLKITVKSISRPHWGLRRV